MLRASTLLGDQFLRDRRRHLARGRSRRPRSTRASHRPPPRSSRVCSKRNRERRPSSFAEVREYSKMLSARGARSPRHPTECWRPVLAVRQGATPPSDARAQEAGPSNAQSHLSAALSAQWPTGVGTPRTVLVLPFEAVGAQEDSSFIGIGLASVIQTDLAKIAGISVLSKAAGAGRAHQTGQGARELARELGANILLEGEVMRAVPMIRITARLTDVESGRVIWGDQYRATSRSSSTCRTRSCGSVAGALKVSLSLKCASR